MAWARHSGATLGANVAGPGTSWNAGNLGATPNANERVIAVVDVNSGGSQPTVTGITDSAGNAWTKDGSIQPAGFGYFEELSVWSCVANGSAVNNLTVAISYSGSQGTPGAGISVGTYSGLSTATGAGAAVDISKFSSGSNSFTADSGTTSGTTTGANELKIGAGSDAGNTLTYTAGTVDTTYSNFIKNDANGNSETAIEDADSGASGSTARAEFTFGAGSANYCMGVLVYKLAAAGGPDLNAFPGEPQTGSSPIQGGLR